MLILTEHIEPALQATESMGVIRELSSRLVDSGAISHAMEKPVLEALFERERTLSTGIGAQIAMPHAVTSILTEPLVAFGLSHDGVEFHSIDGILVNFIFLFITPPGSHIRLLKDFPGALSRTRLQSIQMCSTAHEIGLILNSTSYQ